MTRLVWHMLMNAKLYEALQGLFKSGAIMDPETGNAPKAISNALEAMRAYTAGKP